MEAHRNVGGLKNGCDDDPMGSRRLQGSPCERLRSKQAGRERELVDLSGSGWLASKREGAH